MSNTKSNDADIIRVAVLIDELKHEDISTRINSINNLTTIAATLGATRTREELIPFLSEFIDDEDEVIVALTDQVGSLIDYLGDRQYSYLLLNILEQLSTLEENLIRQKIVSSFTKIINSLTLSDIITHILPLVKRLATNNYYTPRITSLGLFSPVYEILLKHSKESDNSNISEAMAQLRQNFFALCSDITPMVRRVAVTNLCIFALLFDSQIVVNELINSNIFNNLAHDSQDSVRLLIMNACVSLATVLSHDVAATYVTPVVKACCQDPSWRVRYVAADKLASYAIINSSLLSQDDLVDAFYKLLSDSEAEVRAAACLKLKEIVQLSSSSHVVKKIIPCLRSLVNDNCQYVRAALATVIIHVSTILSKQDTLIQLVPLFLVLLKDPHPEVKLHFISTFDPQNTNLDVHDMINSLLPAIFELSKDAKWRIRQSIITLIPLIAKIFGKDFFTEKLSDLCMTWLFDSVYDVRETTIGVLIELRILVGQEWAKEKIIPSLNNLLAMNNYLFRLTALHFIKNYCEHLYQTDPSSLSDFLVPFLTKLYIDPIPNVRFNVAKIISSLNQPIIASEQTYPKISNIVNTLIKDKDADVRYYSSIALESIKKM